MGKGVGVGEGVCVGVGVDVAVASSVAVNVEVGSASLTGEHAARRLIEIRSRSSFRIDIARQNVDGFSKPDFTRYPINCTNPLRT